MLGVGGVNDPRGKGREGGVLGGGGVLGLRGKGRKEGRGVGVEWVLCHRGKGVVAVIFRVGGFRG